jgi:DNA polymerase-3 subunit delta'
MTPPATLPAPGFLSLGQSSARGIAMRAAAAGRLQRSLLVHGPAGAGKEAFVDDLLALCLCGEPDVSGRPCNACRGCIDARRRAHPDLVIGSPESWRLARSAGESIVAAARRWLLDAAGAPVVADRRVLLIEAADRANEQTQNALLRALEEPTGRHMLILVADEPSRLLPTIRSRCQTLRLGPVPRADLAAWLVDRERLPADQADALARIANGMAGTAIAYARNPELVAWRRRVQRELLSLLEHGRADRFAVIRELLDETARLGVGPPPEPDGVDTADGGDAVRLPAAQQREAALLLVDAWIGLTRDLMVAAAGRPALAPTVELVPDLPSVATRIGATSLTSFARLLERVHDGLALNAAPRLALEAAMLDWPDLGPAPGGR